MFHSRSAQLSAGLGAPSPVGEVAGAHSGSADEFTFTVSVCSRCPTANEAWN